MSDHPAVVTVKVSSSMSSGRQASIANVMTVINNPEKTTLRTVIASEIKAANPSLGFDDTKHIAAVETGEETNIKQLLDLPMSILLKQQVGIQDGVIHVTVDMPSPIMKKPPPRAASKEYTVINNKNRINPFRDSTRENFPPLNELFRSSSAASPAQTKQSSLRSSPMNLSSISSRTSSTSVCNDFALDMSIAGQAAMAHHRYQIEKYGIDGDKLSNNNSSNDDIISPLSEEKDWDHLMDSNESVALTDVNNTLFLSRVSESQLLSPLNMTDVGDSYFDKSSVIEALKTPEKTADDEGGRVATKPPMCGVTLSRGGNNNNDLDYSTDENSIILGSSSPYASSQVTTTSGLNGIFRAAMRLHDDLDNDKSSRVAAADGNESSVSTNVSMSRKGRKSLSVSFAMDESFAIERQSSSKKTTHRANDDDLDEFGDFLLSPIGKEENKDVTFHVDSSFIAHQPSPSSSCVKNSCLETSPNVSPSNSGEMASTPTASGRHKQSTTMSILRSKSLDDEFFRRKLEFDSPGEQKGAASEIGIYGMKASPSSKDVGLSSGIIRKNSSTSSVDKYCSERLSRDDTHTTTPLDESSFVLSHKETQALPLHGVRVFGSDASSRLNSQTSMQPNSVESSARTNASNNSSKSADRKGAEASGVSKFFAFGFDMIDMACSSGSRVHSGNNSI